MASASADGYRPGPEDGRPPEITPEELTDRVAELAAGLSEADSKPLRHRLARQIPQLASRTSRATRRSLQSGGVAAWQGLQSGRNVAWQGLQSGRDRGGQAARKGGEAARRGGEAARRGGEAARRGGGVAWRGVQVGGSATWQGLRVGGQWLAAEAMDMAPKVPIRGITTLQEQYPGLGSEELADRLIKTAARASAGVGAAVGTAAATPFVPTLPVELAVETLGLVAIELKLVAELHEVYGMPAPGSRTDRMLAYLGAWANRRGIRITTGEGLALAVGSPLRRKLERRLVAKAGQSTLSLAPLLAGAAAGSIVDHHETRKLGLQVREDLRKRAAGAR